MLNIVKNVNKCKIKFRYLNSAIMIQISIEEYQAMRQSKNFAKSLTF